MLVAVVPLAHWIVAGLDRRFHWSDTVPDWLQAAGFIVLALGVALFWWSMRVNRFFSSVPRIQSERGHRVVTAGPYACVRLPGYIAAIAFVLASGLALGSWASVLAFSPALAMLFYARSLRMRSSRRSCRATPITPRGYAGAGSPASGEAAYAGSTSNPPSEASLKPPRL